jgi:hypothetical protein
MLSCKTAKNQQNQPKSVVVGQNKLYDVVKQVIDPGLVLLPVPYHHLNHQSI